MVVVSTRHLRARLRHRDIVWNAAVSLALHHQRLLRITPLQLLFVVVVVVTGDHDVDCV